MPINRIVSEEALDLGCNLLRAIARSILPLDQKSKVTGPRAQLLHLFPESDLA